MELFYEGDKKIKVLNMLLMNFNKSIKFFVLYIDIFYIYQCYLNPSMSWSKS